MTLIFSLVALCSAVSAMVVSVMYSRRARRNMLRAVAAAERAEGVRRSLTPGLHRAAPAAYQPKPIGPDE